jgi:hypothetical protein
MSVLSFAADDLFIVRIVKSLTTNPDNKWVNTYEFKANTVGDDATLNIVASAFLLFEATLHHNVVRFHEVIVSTWEADSKPYDPNAFLTIPTDQTGLTGPVGDLLPLNQTLSVARIPTSGRFGHVFFRGVLGEDEVEAPAGKAILTSVAEIATRLNAAVDAAELEGFFGNPSEGPMQLAMISADGETVRPVLGFVAQGVSAVPQDHAWFNRTTSLSARRGSNVRSKAT